MIKFKEIKGKVTCITGLRIGGKDSTAEIGGVDNPIIRNPLDGMPYIPGSSLKGKMRFLMEHNLNLVSQNGDPHKCNNDDCLICKVFGKNADVKNKDGKLTIGRAVFRDAFLTEESKKRLEAFLKETGLNYAERKMENVINRKKGAAEHPRETERIPAGVVFDFAIGFRVFEDKDEALIKEVIEKGLKLIEQDALGASGSRGYGKVKFEYTVLDTAG